MYYFISCISCRINGDLEVIPVSSTFCDINIRDANNASNVNIHQIINGWQQYVDIEVSKQQSCWKLFLDDSIDKIAIRYK